MSDALNSLCPPDRQWGVCERVPCGLPADPQCGGRQVLPHPRPGTTETGTYYIYREMNVYLLFMDKRHLYLDCRGDTVYPSARPSSFHAQPPLSLPPQLMQELRSFLPLNWVLLGEPLPLPLRALAMGPGSPTAAGVLDTTAVASVGRTYIYTENIHAKPAQNSIRNHGNEPVHTWFHANQTKERARVDVPSTRH